MPGAAGEGFLPNLGWGFAAAPHCHPAAHQDMQSPLDSQFPPSNSTPHPLLAMLRGQAPPGTGTAQVALRPTPTLHKDPSPWRPYGDMLTSMQRGAWLPEVSARLPDQLTHRSICTTWSVTAEGTLLPGPHPQAPNWLLCACGPPARPVGPYLPRVLVQHGAHQDRPPTSSAAPHTTLGDRDRPTAAGHLCTSQLWGPVSLCTYEV